MASGRCTDLLGAGTQDSTTRPCCSARLPLLRAHRPNASLAAAARQFQSGVVNDYVTWIVIGLAALGGIFATITG